MCLAHDANPRAVQVKPLQARLESEGAILTPRA
jgi:hypothetical protein